jgi:hypothetical protein
MVSFKVLHKIPTLLKKSLQIKWTQSNAVGDKSFLEQMKKLLGIRAKGRHVKGDGVVFLLYCIFIYDTHFLCHEKHG